jgi:ABC-type multidrug transport system fused ATPase/permease subunit
MTATAAVLQRTTSTEAGTIEARNFSFWYGKKQALKNITMAIPPRAVTALTGHLAVANRHSFGPLTG